VRLATAAGIIGAEFAGERVRMRMPNPTRLRRQLTVTVKGRTLHAGFINTGVPHLVVPVRGLNTVDVEGLGRALRTHRMFRPRGTNVDFVESAGPRAARVRIRTYERGVEAETLACGTGVTAAGVLQVLERPDPTGAVRRVHVQTRSGDVLTVSCRIDGRGDVARVRNVVLEGPVQRICEGLADWPRRDGNPC
jgi:diaminopimelate epimerase